VKKQISDDTDRLFDEEPEPKHGGVWRAIRTIVLLVALAVFCYAAWNLYQIYSSYKVGTDEYKALKQYVVYDSSPADTGTGTDISESGEVDFDSLKAINSDVAAWVRFPNPDIIDYPIMHSSDNSTYLKHTFDGTSNSSGALFMDMNNKADFTDPNVVVYGHAMKNGSMFGSLKQYRDQDFCVANPYFFIYTPDGGIYKYLVCAVYETDDTSDTYTITFGTKADYRNYLNMISEKSFYGTGVTLTESSRLVTLSTCTNATESGRLVVQGVRSEVLRQANPPIAELLLPD